MQKSEHTLSFSLWLSRDPVERKKWGKVVQPNDVIKSVITEEKLLICASLSTHIIPRFKNE